MLRMKHFHSQHHVVKRVLRFHSKYETSKITVKLDIHPKSINDMALKFVSYVFFILSKERISKIMKNASYFIYKAAFVVEIFIFCIFPFLLIVFRLKGSDETEIIKMSWIGLHKFANPIFGIIQKPIRITSSKLPLQWTNKKWIFLGIFSNPKTD